jgi:inositol-1,3,4-trisphosphate 5/6-kinase/inositol-tetrakisphosphate 1-kinase
MNIEHLDEKTRERLSFVRKIIAERPYVLVIERLEAVQRVLDRVVMYSFLHSQLTEKLQTDVVHVPAITILDESVQTIDQIRNQFQRDNVHFPIVCKTVAACGDIKTHNMAMVFTEEQLLQVLKSPEQEIPLPIIAQQYINHDALLYKAYVIGEHVFVQERTSLRNMDPNEPDIIRFNSQYPLPKELLPTNSQEINLAFKNIKPLITDSKLISLFKDIAKVLSQALELELFGFDLIKQTETGKYYCVDTNYLPGYSGVEDVHAKLLNHILTKYKQQRELLGI